MSPAWPRARAVLRLGGLTLLLLLLLLLCPQAARGDCSLPPNIPNAQPDLKGLTSFPEQSIITYKCDQGFVKIPGQPDSVVCLKNNEWSNITEFCNRSCNFPARLLFASLKKPYNQQNYFPLGSIVEYECRLGYKRDHSLSGKITCLQNFTWSKPDEFCKRKSCPNPGEITNGHINIATDILFGSSITFSCNTGYELVGETSSYCIIVGQTLGWSDPLPECKESTQIVDVTQTPQKPTTANIPATELPSAPQRPTTVKAPATQSQAVPQETTPFQTRSTSKSKETLPVGASTIVSGKFGSPAVKRNCHHCRIKSQCFCKRTLLSMYCRDPIKIQCCRNPIEIWYCRNPIKIWCLWVTKEKTR
ncbi:complement decay-accelerating factor isoform X1 [Pteropus medius]|uniref:complement decay-accelerating factor isoform X1 n=1 Tax=Pteropus vampyrus TaxID=132908 RepID=UPI00196B26A6|nr:complement decay-accelerating factor isoform X1 [Pteropus giganteus]